MKVKMKYNVLPNCDTKRGTQKKRERANIHTNTRGPERANFERAGLKKKTEADGHGKKNQRCGGEDGSV